MKTIYLHIGMHKTGSSTIQEGLYQNREQLEASGYAYPCLRDQEFAHHNLVWELKQSDQFDPSLCKLDDLRTFIEQTQHDKIIISTEEFSKVDVEHLRKFMTYLNGHQVKVVVYFRRQDQLMQSTWAQNVKTGILRLTFEEWFNSVVFDEPLPEDRATPKLKQHMPELATRIQYDTFIAKYASVFGEENIMVRAYERPYMNPNIVVDFLAFIGMDDVAWVPEKSDSNVSPSIKTLELLRQVSIGWQTKTHNSAFIHTQAYQEYFSELEQIVDKLGWNDQRLNLIDQARYDAFMNRYGEGNKIVAQTYLGRDDLFQDPFVDHPITSFDAEDFEAEELMAVMEEVAVMSLTLIKSSDANLVNRSKTEATAQMLKSNPMFKRLLMPFVRLLRR